MGYQEINPGVIDGWCREGLVVLPVGKSSVMGTLAGSP